MAAGSLGGLMMGSLGDLLVVSWWSVGFCGRPGRSGRCGGPGGPSGCVRRCRHGVLLSMGN